MRNLSLQRNAEQIDKLVSVVVSTYDTDALLDLVSSLFPIFVELYRIYATPDSDELEWFNISVYVCYNACFSFPKMANISFSQYYRSLLQQKFFILS